jgi:hypothetical protein
MTFGNAFVVDARECGPDCRCADGDRLDCPCCTQVSEKDVKKSGGCCSEAGQASAPKSCCAFQLGTMIDLESSTSITVEAYRPANADDEASETVCRCQQRNSSPLPPPTESRIDNRANLPTSFVGLKGHSNPETGLQDFPCFGFDPGLAILSPVRRQSVLSRWRQ